jgi:hypothetical protein
MGGNRVPLADFPEGQNVVIECGWAGKKKVGSLPNPLAIEKLVPPLATAKPASVNGENR